MMDITTRISKSECMHKLNHTLPINIISSRYIENIEPVAIKDGKIVSAHDPRNDRVLWLLKLSDGVIGRPYFIVTDGLRYAGVAEMLDGMYLVRDTQQAPERHYVMSKIREFASGL